MDTSFEIWIPRYLSSIETKNYSANTTRAYGRTLQLFGRYMTYLATHENRPPNCTTDFADCGLTADVDATPIEITDFLTLIRKEGNLKPASLRQYNAALGAFYKHLVRQDILATNPMGKVDRPKIKDRKPVYMRHDEVRKLLAALINSPRAALIIRTIYVTGLRVSELCGLQIEDIDFDEQTFTVYGKGGKFRTVFCDPETLDLIKKHLKDRTAGPVFLNRYGDALSTNAVRKMFNKYAPTGITPHKIRHSFASELYKQSHNIRAVQELLGHSSIQTTQIYVHMGMDERKKVYQKFGAMAP